MKAKRIEHINGVGMNTERFNKELTEDEKTAKRHELSLNENDVVFSYVAELNKNKNQILLIDVIKELRKKRPNVKLLLVGKGNLEKEYGEIIEENGLKDNIKMLGMRKDINEILSITDIYLASSIREGLPVNIMEAMYKGSPIIATSNRGHRELVKNGENGFVVENKDEMIAKINQILDNKDLAEKLGKNGRQKSELYKIENIFKKMIEIYK